MQVRDLNELLNSLLSRDEGVVRLSAKRADLFVGDRDLL
jgi:hypothetical protein